MQTERPAHRRLYDISEVACPDSCNRPPEEKGCHFRMGPDRFTCTKCQLRIWRGFMGYELTATDLQEMLHGDKVTSTEKTLTRKKDGQEITLRGRLVFNEEYKVRLAPKIKSKVATAEVCPNCGAGKLQLITSIDDSKWYGCSNYPQCRFTRAYLPHTFKPATPATDIRSDKPESKTAGSARNARDATGSGGHGSQASMQKKHAVDPPQKSTDTKPTSGKPAGPVIAENGTTRQALGVVSDGLPGRQSSSTTYRRIPRFILDMLHLSPTPMIGPDEPGSIS